MKQCPKCGNRYPDESTVFCLVDGEPLVESNPSAETLNYSQPIIFEHHENARVQVGSYHDIEFRNRKIRVSIKGISREKILDKAWYLASQEEDVAQINVNTGGGLVYGGDRTKFVTTNEYLIPVHRHEEETVSIYSFYYDENRFFFLRVYVEHIDTYAHAAELNVLLLTK